MWSGAEVSNVLSPRRRWSGRARHRSAPRRAGCPPSRECTLVFVSPPRVRDGSREQVGWGVSFGSPLQGCEMPEREIRWVTNGPYPPAEAGRLDWARLRLQPLIGFENLYMPEAPNRFQSRRPASPWVRPIRHPADLPLRELPPARGSRTRRPTPLFPGTVAHIVALDTNARVHSRDGGQPARRGADRCRARPLHRRRATGRSGRKSTTSSACCLRCANMRPGVFCFNPPMGCASAGSTARRSCSTSTPTGRAPGRFSGWRVACFVSHARSVHAFVVTIQP